MKVDDSRKWNMFRVLVCGVLSSTCVAGVVIGSGIQRGLDERWGARYSFCSSRLVDLTDILDCTLRQERVVPPPLPPSVIPEPTRMPRNIIKG